MSDRSQRTEKPTPHRLQKARREGQFPASRHFVGSMQFLAFVALLAWGAGEWTLGLAGSFRWLVARGFSGELTPEQIAQIGHDLLWRNGVPLLAGAGLILAVTLGSQLIVTGMGLSLKRVTPSLDRANPVSRLRELPVQNLTSLAQALVLLPLFSWLVYSEVKRHLYEFLTMPLASTRAGTFLLTQSLRGVLWKGAAAFLVLGLVDWMRERNRYLRNLRMSKQEIREELKETEGNPLLKSRIRRLRRDLLRRRMMQEVPTATTVIVNPTHFAVALRYHAASMTAPIVVAKGKNYLALRIRQKAIEHNVPLVENPPLAQALYKGSEVGQEIPPHLYRAVAEILAYIYRVMQAGASR